MRVGVFVPQPGDDHRGAEEIHFVVSASYGASEGIKIRIVHYNQYTLVNVRFVTDGKETDRLGPAPRPYRARPR